MTTQPPDLAAALVSFFHDVGQGIEDFVGLADRDAADAMAKRPSARLVREVAHTTAVANGYLVGSDGRRAGGKTAASTAGRVLSGQMLHRLGIAGLLRSGAPVDVSVLAKQTAAYLAGPAVPLHRYVVLDVDWDLAEPLTLVGWRLWRPSEQDWNALRPVPLAADFAAKPSFDPMLAFGRHLVLSAEDPDAEPVDNRIIFWWLSQRRARELEAWAPLLCLNLAQDTPVMPVAEYLIEPGRTVTTYYESIPSTPVGPDGDHEVPQLGPLYVDEGITGWLAGFLAKLSPKLEEWLAAPKPKSGDRLEPVAVRFLDTCAKIAYDAEVNFGEDPEEVAFDYVVALERLVSAKDVRNDLKRSTAQRTAVLVGGDDAQRLAIYNLVATAYNVRSAVAHGSTPKKHELESTINHLRPIVRRALIRTIILGPHLDPDTVFDDALLSTQVRRDRIQTPVDRFLNQLPNTPGTVHADS